LLCQVDEALASLPNEVRRKEIEAKQKRRRDHKLQALNRQMTTLQAALSTGTMNQQQYQSKVAELIVDHTRVVSAAETAVVDEHIEKELSAGLKHGELPSDTMRSLVGQGTVLFTHGGVRAFRFMCWADAHRRFITLTWRTTFASDRSRNNLDRSISVEF